MSDTVEKIETTPCHYVPNVDKMYTYIRGYLVGAKMTQSIVALQFAREKHKNQTRKNGVPYIVHPLSMVSYAIALNVSDDNIISTLLLHDVAEDCGIAIENLPVNDTVKNAVKHMTVTKFDTDVNKIETKCRYFKNLLECKEALICKAFDRYDNLSDMAFSLTDDAIGKNAAETDILLLPVLKEAKEKWAELSNILYALRTNIRRMNDVLKFHHMEEYEKWAKLYKRIPEQNN